jgi:hypothetical protein
MRIKRIITAPFADEEPEVVTAEELAARFNAGQLDGKQVAKAARLGVLVPLGGDRFEVPSPRLLDAAEEVMRQGVPLSAALSVVEEIRKHSEAVARSFVKLVVDHVLKPFNDAGTPEDEWPRVVEAIEHLRPLASQALLAVFQQTMTREVEEAFGKELYKRSKRG